MDLDDNSQSSLKRRKRESDLFDNPIFEVPVNEEVPEQRYTTGPGHPTDNWGPKEPYVNDGTDSNLAEI